MRADPRVVAHKKHARPEYIFSGVCIWVGYQIQTAACSQRTNGDMPVLENHVNCSDPNIVMWLNDHGGRHLWADLLCYTIRWKSYVESQSMKTCLGYEDEDNAFKIKDVERGVTQLFECGDLNLLKVLLAKRASNQQRSPKKSRDVSQTFFSYLIDIFGAAFFKGSIQYNFDVTVLEFDWVDQDARLEWTNDAMAYASKYGKLEMIELLYNAQVETVLNVLLSMMRMFWF